MTMGIQKVEESDWLAIDNRYLPEQAFRRDLLATKRHNVLQVLPGSEAACAEVLEVVVNYVTQRYPTLFYSPAGKNDYVHNSLTGRTFKVTYPYELEPLEIAAQLVMEDLNVLIQGFGEDPEQHYLAASYSMAPAGWHLEERIGWPLWKIHTPVPLWKDKLRASVEKFFTRMQPGDIVSRHNFFVQADDVLFQADPFPATLAAPPTIESLRIRHERQTLRRLPKTGVILFTVRTYLTPLTDLEDDPESMQEFLGAIRAFPESIARYKNRHLWGETVETWCEEKLEKASAEC
ncbi:hypothetical protein EDD36DRAFT_201567 [Exophiala viscosa]|uniref:DUF3445 domain-containing protein n=1 Tax=Exophiala viscosa TaxID=2486360 RepID=A0AAN6DZB4_9EURO|nr:hypothetical protein EDD36DRAFT_201567 [Exophiala viscosa]